MTTALSSFPTFWTIPVVKMNQFITESVILVNCIGRFWFLLRLNNIRTIGTIRTIFIPRTKFVFEAFCHEYSVKDYRCILNDLHFPLYVMECQSASKVTYMYITNRCSLRWKSLPISPTNGSRSVKLAPNVVKSPAYQGNSLILLKCRADAPHKL